MSKIDNPLFSGRRFYRQGAYPALLYFNRVISVYKKVVMASIRISHSFTMPAAALKAQLDRLVLDMASKYRLDCRWTADHCLTFKRSGASGEIVISDNQLVLTMTLGLVLSAFKATIEQDIRKFMNEHIQ